MMAWLEPDGVCDPVYETVRMPDGLWSDCDGVWKKQLEDW